MMNITVDEVIKHFVIEFKKDEISAASKLAILSHN